MADKKEPNILDQFRAMLDDHLGKAEFLKAFEAVVKRHKDFEGKTAKDLGTLAQTLSGRVDQLTSGASTDLQTFKDEMQRMMTEALAKVAETDTKMAVRTAAVKDGQNADPEQVIGEVLARIQLPEQKEILLDTPEDIRNKLELLQDDERLDASAIRNLPEAIKKHTAGSTTPHVIGGHGPLWGLQDVDVTGVVVGQSIKWDGIRWIPYTPAGGSGATAVYNEVASGSATTFTLAHTPTSSAVLRVYANGQRLTPTTDYSLSSATITTVNSWSANAITADYEY